MSKFSKQTSDVFYGEHIGKPFFPNLQEFITSDVAVGMELVKDGGIQGWRSFIGPTNTLKAKEEAPNSIRALFGTDGTKMGNEPSVPTALKKGGSPQNIVAELVQKVTADCSGGLGNDD